LFVIFHTVVNNFPCFFPWRLSGYCAIENERFKGGRSPTSGQFAALYLTCRKIGISQELEIECGAILNGGSPGWRIVPFLLQWLTVDSEGGVMQRIMLKSKIHRAVLTGANLDYEGSVAIDPILLEAADILPNEQVQVLNVNNGNRITTYAIAAERGSGTIMLNGPAARSGMTGDVVVILTFAHVDADELAGYSPKIIKVDKKNRLI